MATRGRFRVRQRQRDGIHLGGEQGSGTRNFGKLRNAVGRGLGPVRRAKGIMHKNVAQGGHFLRQFFVVFLLALVDAAVFQQYQLTGLHADAIDPVGQ